MVFIPFQFPGLFSGCHFYFHGDIEYPNPTKEELVNLVKLGGGTVLCREPKQETIDQSEVTVPYHAKPGSQFENTSYFILYDPDVSADKVSQRHGARLGVVPISWFMDTIAWFEFQELPSTVSNGRYIGVNLPQRVLDCFLVFISQSLWMVFVFS